MAAALRRVRGVVSATVDKRRSEAVVTRRRGTAPGSELTRAVRRVGYGATVIPTVKTTLRVADMGCSGCPEKVQAALQRVAGVRGVRMPSRTEAVVYYDRRRVSTTQLVQAVKRSGFTARAQG